MSVNLIASTALRGYKADLTQDGLFTISDGTRKVLRAIDEPINVRVYFSKKLGEAAPNFAKNFERVRALLEQYRDISGGKLRLAFLDPEPFSDAEDRAVAAGLRGMRLNPEGEPAISAWSPPTRPTTTRRSPSSPPIASASSNTT